jgi:hypothetical protein
VFQTIFSHLQEEFVAEGARETGDGSRMCTIARARSQIRRACFSHAAHQIRSFAANISIADLHTVCENGEVLIDMDMRYGARDNPSRFSAFPDLSKSSKKQTKL